MLVLVWRVLADQDVRFIDLGPDFYERRIKKERRARDLVRQLQALGHTVTLNPANGTPPRAEFCPAPLDKRAQVAELLTFNCPVR
jgi:hypothetical protein